MVYLKFDTADNYDIASMRNSAVLLLEKVLYDALGFKNARGKIKFAKGGKPYIENADFDFSYAHTSGAVAVAVCGKGNIDTDSIISDISFKKIGIDIEPAGREIGEKTIDRISKKLFTDMELSYLNREPAGRQKRFLEIWTKKESIIKATGEGLAGISRADTNGYILKFIETRYVSAGGKDYIISVAGI